MTYEDDCETARCALQVIYFLNQSNAMFLLQKAKSRSLGTDELKMFFGSFKTFIENVYQDKHFREEGGGGVWVKGQQNDWDASDCKIARLGNVNTRVISTLGMDF